MRWTPGGESRDIEDRRGSTGGRVAGLGIGGTVVVLVLSVLFGHNFFNDLGPGGAVEDNPPAMDSGGGQVAPIAEAPGEHERVQFVSFVLDDVQREWDVIFPTAFGAPYEHAK